MHRSIAPNQPHCPQVAMRSPCCKRWYECDECHDEANPDHPLKKSVELVFACKKCKAVFRKDMALFEEADEFCPKCDNHFVIDAETPETRALQKGAFFFTPDPHSFTGQLMAQVVAPGGPVQEGTEGVHH